MDPSRSKYRDPKGKHSRLYASMTNGFAWKAIDFTARAFYVDLLADLGEANNGNIASATDAMRSKGWTHGRTVARCLYQLLAVGLIAKTRQGGIGGEKRVCSLFRFTHVATLEMRHLGVDKAPVTNDFMKFQSLEHAQHALAEGVAEMEKRARSRQHKRKSRVPKVNLQGAECEPKSPITGSHTEVRSRVRVPIQNLPPPPELH